MAQKKKSFLPDFDHPEKVEQPDEKQREKLRKQYIRKLRWQKILTVFMVLVVSIYVVGGIYAVRYANKLLKGMPTLNVDDLISTESSKIYDGNGTLLTEIGTYYRENIPYEQMPESLIDAFLSVEDSRFFEHNGFDIPRFTKSILETVLHHNTQGGSTFTMQLVKNTYFSIEDGDNSTERSATLSYKAQQIVLSMQLEKQLSKREIFELYVNKLNFGDRIRGVQKAAQYYYGKNANQLTLAESALLAGIINLPNTYNPYNYLDYATQRRNNVLDLMQYHGYITSEECALAKSIKVEDTLVGKSNFNTGNTRFASYLDVVLDEVQRMTGLDPLSTGMSIYTALDPTIQTEIEAIQNGEVVNFESDLVQLAMITLNNKNGEIVGVGGGRNYGGDGGSRLLNRALQQYKQPGSSIKPVLEYALAFEYLGFSLDEVLIDRPITYPAEQRVLVNYNGKYEGDVTLKDAMANSLNTPAIQTLEKVTAKIGSDAVVDYLKKIGFSQVKYGNYHLSYAIGGNDFTASVAEMAAAHAMLVNLGVYNEPHTIRRIQTDDGNVYEPQNQNVRALSSGSAYLVDQLMENNVNQNKYYNHMQILQSGYPVYAKTGTTDWGNDGLQYGIPSGAAKDKWMIASTSQYTNAVWYGFDQAIDGEMTYFPTWRDLNTPGQINRHMLDIESYISPDTIGGVTQPSDVQDVTYLYGTYPHVANDGSSYGGKTITSQVSSSGLNYTPTQYASSYRNNSSYLAGLNASISNGIVYINWLTQDTCSGSRNISLKDNYNNISKSGACLAYNSFLQTSANGKFYADLYQDDVYITSVTSKTNMYAGLPEYFKGKVKACGYFVTSSGKKSDTICTDAGYYDPDATAAKDAK